MISGKGKAVNSGSFSLNVKILFFLLAHEFAKETQVNMPADHFACALSLKRILPHLNENIYLPSTAKNRNLIEDGHSDTGKSNSCQYIKSSKQLICSGSLDLSYIKIVRNEEILNFIIEKYAVDSTSQKTNTDSNCSVLGESHLTFPNIYQKLTGQIQLKKTGLQINVILSILPKNNITDHYSIQGEAFSTKVIKFSRPLKGDLLLLKSIENRTILEMNVEAADSNAKWSIRSHLKHAKRNPETNWDEWTAEGRVRFDYYWGNQTAPFRGSMETRIAKGTCQFLSELHLENVNLSWDVKGSVASPCDKPVSIPRGAFSNMSVKNIIFKESDFFNDFDKNVFEGLKGVETISFLTSKLEIMPKLNELFQSFTQVKEINIEDCATPYLNFGVKANLKNVEKVSFKGSGPLNFYDFSFSWLQFSNVTHLNLKNSYIIVPLKGISVLRGISHSLKHLDVSHSSLRNENDLSAVLESLKIRYLIADGLSLKNIPTNALSKVSQTLEYLSMRGSHFGKDLEKNMLNNIFNFPAMSELKELNLEECQINYLERGAFENLPNLKVLHLGKNNLENLQEGWILTRPRISHLDLSFNGMTPRVPYLEMNAMEASLNLSNFKELESLDLSNGIFSNVKKIIESLGGNLRRLHLKNIYLNDLREGLFHRLTGLEVLNISFNKNLKKIQTISFDLFRNLKRLKSLTLKNCRINTSATDRFGEIRNRLENLDSLDLSQNKIKIIDLKVLKSFPRLRILNLSGNGITSWNSSLFQHNKFLETILLDENKIETISPEMISDLKKFKSVKLGNNPFVCGPYVFEILKMARAVPVKKFPMDESGLEDENKIYLNQLEEKSNYSSNGDEFDPNWTSFLRDIEMVKYGNPVIGIDPNVMVRTLEFSSGYITSVILEFFTRKHKCPKTVHQSSKLHHNPRTFRMNSILDWSETNYVCFSRSKGKFIPFSSVNETFEDLNLEKIKGIKKFNFFWTPIVAVSGMVIAIGIVCWKLLDIHLIARAVKNAVALSFLSRENKDRDNYLYNVFVSYSDKDRQWVIENLIPRLESKKDVKVCLHERDFQVGLSILENIIASIDSSSNIVLVLSKSFLKSHWCQYEMHLAQHRLLEKGSDQLILILLENISLVRRPKILRYLMMTKTYLEWPANSKNPKEIELFWSRLLKSLNLN